MPGRIVARSASVFRKKKGGEKSIRVVVRVGYRCELRDSSTRNLPPDSVSRELIGIKGDRWKRSKCPR